MLVNIESLPRESAGSVPRALNPDIAKYDSGHLPTGAHLGSIRTLNSGDQNLKSRLLSCRAIRCFLNALISTLSDVYCPIDYMAVEAVI